MDHFKIVGSDRAENCVMFSHFTMDAPPGTWKRENKISLNRIKLNVFIEGEFSVFAADRVWRPTCGDVCIFPPSTVHCGQISKHVHLDYYELDVGVQAMDCIPGGRDLLDSLVGLAVFRSYFVKPHREDIGHLIDLCARVESAIANEDMPVAFSRTVELLSAMRRIFQSGSEVRDFVLSRVTNEVIRTLEENFDEALGLDALAERAGVSRSYLSRLFKREVGMGIHEYLMKYRTVRAAYLLKEGMGVAEVGYACGFCDSSHFISVFKKHYGITPSEYRKAAEN